MEVFTTRPRRARGTVKLFLLSVLCGLGLSFGGGLLLAGQVSPPDVAPMRVDVALECALDRVACDSAYALEFRDNSDVGR